MRKRMTTLLSVLVAFAVSAFSVKTLSLITETPESVSGEEAVMVERDNRADVYFAEEKQINDGASALSLESVVAEMSFQDAAPLRETAFITPVMASGIVPIKETLSISDMAAGYVWSASSLITESYGGYDAGGSITVTDFDAATGAITLSGFPQSGLKLSGTLNPETGVITFPYQVVGVNQTYGNVAFGDVSTTKPDRTKAVTAQITADGNIVISQWWGIFVDTAGDNYNSLFGAWYNTVAIPANTTIVAKRYNAAGVLQGTSTYPAIVKQTGRNLLSVSNYMDGGKSVDFILNTDSTATLNSQIVKTTAAGSWLSIGNMNFDEAGKFTSYTGTSTSVPSVDDKKIILNSVGLLTTGYYDGPYSVTINCPEAISYPVISTSSLEGDGSQSNPYKVSSLDDLVYLASAVNSVTEMNATNGYSEFARVFIGKYFEMTADIDMNGYQFTAIGSDWSHHFAGTFDGKGHTIKGLHSEAFGYNCAGLFGRTDTLSVIKNINFVDAHLVSNGSYAAAPIAWSLGVIDNVTAKNTYAYAAQQGAGGISGLSKTITNCSVEGATLYAGMGFAGGLTGQLDILVENCYATDVKITTGTTAGYPYGGLIGSLSGATARNCFATSIIDAYSNYTAAVVGGFAAYASLATVDKCFAVTNITGYGNECVNGGVIGRTYGAKITNCYSAGRINGYASRFTGGIVGWTYDYYGNTTSPIVNTEVRNCYTSAYMQAETYLYSPDSEYRETLGYVGPSANLLTQGYAPSAPVIENIYFNNQMTNFGSTHYGATTAELTSAAGPKGFDADVWVFTEGNYPRLKGLENAEAAKYSASAILMANGNSVYKISENAQITPMGVTLFGFYNNGQLSVDGHFAKIQDNIIVLNSDYNIGTDTLFVVNGKVNYWMPVKIAPVPFEGQGTEDNPYLIKTKKDLVDLSVMTTKAKQLFNGTYFKMTNDIDLELSDDFIGICTNADEAANKFMGVFDGGNFTIHRMKSGTVTIPADGSKPTGVGITGFIGRLGEEGILRNIRFASDCQIFGFAQMASAVGYLYGTVENVRNYADVTGISCWVGGIVGNSVGKTGVIRNCYNAGTVTSGYFNVGGIIGSGYCLIENCVNTGDVVVKSISSFNASGTGKLTNAGGICGGTYGIVMRNCLNTGTVYAEDSKAGGLASNLAASSSGFGNNDIYSSLNYGEVYCGDPANIGAIASTGGTKGELVSVYFDAQLLPLGALGVSDPLGCKGLTTTVLTSGKPIEGLNAELWDFTAGMYPVLKQFADEPALIAARKFVVDFGEGSTAYNVSCDASLSQSVAWSLASGNKFKINDNLLVPEKPFISSVTDTLYATSGSYVKPILIKGVPPVPFSGNGTAADPYQLGSATDWNGLADYMTVNSMDFSGAYFKIMNDFSFGGSEPEFKMLANDGANYLQFNLNGNGKTISGITFTTTATFQAAIGIIGSEGYVHDLTLEGKITSANASTGGFAAKNYGVIENCVNAVDVISSKGTSAGFAVQTFGNAKYIKCVNKATIQSSGTSAGFTATMTNDGGRVTFIDCVNEGNIKITGTSNLAGFVITAYPSDWTNCVNRGKFEGMGATTQYIAGLIANVSGYANAESYNFTDCGNESDITGKAYIGGLFGFAHKTAGYAKLNLTGCWNKGNIYNSSTATVGSTSGGYAAGITGLVSGGWNVKRCWNSGEIRSDKVVYAGGLFAYYGAAPTAALPTTVDSCYNTGKIIADGNQGGGIFAYVPNYTTITNCWNSGEITGTWGLGGIAAALSGYSKIIDCFNLAPVTASQNRAGGIIGYGSSINAELTRCWNIGDVKTTMQHLTTHTVTNGGYGIGGIAGQTNIPMTDCYNTGNITGNINVGGLIGRCTKGTKNATSGAVTANTTLRNCYNIGKVVALPDSCGAIVGSNTNVNGAYWNEYNIMENCYYVSDVLSDSAASLNANIAKGVNVADLVTTKISDAYVQPADFCLPILSGYADNEGALANSAAPVVAVEQNLNNVKGAWHVGVPSGTSWTANTAAVKISGDLAEYTGSGMEEIVLTVTNGEYSRNWTLKITNYNSGIDSIGDGKEVVSAVYYNVAGVQVPKPEAADGQIYIVAVRYSDGTSAVLKVLNK